VINPSSARTAARSHDISLFENSLPNLAPGRALVGLPPGVIVDPAHGTFKLVDRRNHPGSCWHPGERFDRIPPNGPGRESHGCGNLFTCEMALLPLCQEMGLVSSPGLGGWLLWHFDRAIWEDRPADAPGEAETLHRPDHTPVRVRLPPVHAVPGGGGECDVVVVPPLPRARIPRTQLFRRWSAVWYGRRPQMPVQALPFDGDRVATHPSIPAQSFGLSQ
jgi:hypothetical protein